jgi:hypothetical protein
MAADTAKEHFKVGRSYRLHELSLKPGGTTISVHYTNGYVLDYDNVKYPDSYAQKIVLNHSNGVNRQTGDTLQKITVGERMLWEYPSLKGSDTVTEANVNTKQSVEQQQEIAEYLKSKY